MRNSKLLTTCFVALLSAQCFSIAHSEDALTSQDFVTKAAESNFAEIDVSQLAQSKAHSQDVKDHSKANSQLAQIAKPKDLKVPLGPDMTHKATMQMLHLKSGESFDKAYMEQMDKDHQKAIELFQSAASSPQVDKDLQAFASKTLPKLQEHHQLVAQVESKMPSRSASKKPETDTNR
jgi:putative membrane protein